MNITAAKTLNDRGRCCGRKPIVYKRPHHFYCSRCNASFDPETSKQIPNWAYSKLDDARFECRTTAVSRPHPSTPEK